MKNERRWTTCIFKRFRERGRDYVLPTVLPACWNEGLRLSLLWRCTKSSCISPRPGPKPCGWMGPVLKSSHITPCPALRKSWQLLLMPMAWSFSCCLYVHGPAHAVWYRNGLKCGPQTSATGSHRCPGIGQAVLAACAGVMWLSQAPGWRLLLSSLPLNGHLLLWFTSAPFCQLPAWPGKVWGTSYQTQHQLINQISAVRNTLWLPIRNFTLLFFFLCLDGI